MPDSELLIFDIKTESEAKAEGMHALSGPYSKNQRKFLASALDHIKSDPEIAWMIVKAPRGLELWIKPSHRQNIKAMELSARDFESYQNKL